MVQKYGPHLCILLGGACWGLLGLFNRSLLAGALVPRDVALIRNFGGLLALLAVLLLFDRSALKINWRHLPWFLGTGIVSVLLFTLLYFSCQQQCSLAVAAVLLYTAPTFVVLISAVLWKEPVTRRKLAALAAAFLGCSFVSGIWSGDVTVTVRPTLAQKKDILRNMVDTLRYVEDETPNIALLALVEQPSFHMNDTIEARDLVKEHQRHAIAACNLVGPIAYDLILSKEAARLKGYDNPLCGEFDGIVAPSLLAGNLIVKGWQMHAHARTCGVIVGAKIPVAITSRSDSADVSFLSLAFCNVLPKDCPYL